MASIADVFFRALLDDAQLQVDASKAGDKAGQTLGSRMSTSIGTALKKTAFAGMAGAAAIAGRGLIELQNITADFTAATGASADEAERAGKAINEMGGRNLQPLKEIGDALTKVHTDLGLTGDAAEKTTEKFLKYATATKQNATTAVKGFDDILDAWGLTAEHSGEIMDKLIASHQKYGGSIEENQKSLADLAPQLKALNLSIDDGIGLLNLFETSGLDASVAARALNTAVKNLKPGQSLNDLIAQVSAIEDPTKRAQKAIEIFGSRGGVALANVLRPGITSLKDFEVSATDAAGATEDASNAIEGTFSNQVRLKIKAVGEAIIGVGQSIGPLATGLASLGSLGGMLGLDKVIGKAWHGVAGSALVKTAAKEAGLFIGAIYGAAVGFASEIAEFVSEKWRELLRSTALKAIASRAGTVLGGIYGAAVGVSSKVAESLGEIWEKVASSRLLGPLIAKAGSVAATGYLKALIAGDMIGGALSAVWTKSGGAAIAAAVVQGRLAGLAFAGAAATAAIGIPILLAFAIRPPKLFTPEELQQKSGIDRLAEASGFTITPKVEIKPVVTVNNDEIAKAGLGILSFVNGLPAKIGAALLAGKPVITRAAADAFGDIGPSLAARTNWAVIAHQMANRAAAAVAQGIREKRVSVEDSWQLLMDTIKNVQTPSVQRAKLLGELTSKELAKALKSGRPEVAEQARATKQDIIDQLTALGANSQNIGKDGMEMLRKGMKSKDPDIRAASTAIYNTANSKIKGLPGAGSAAGKGAGQGVATGLNSKYNVVSTAASRLADAVIDNLYRLAHIGGGQARATGGPVMAGQTYTVGEHGPETFVPNTSGTIVPFSLANAVPNMNTSRSGGAGAAAAAITNVTNRTNNFNISLVESRSPDPFEVPRQLRRLAEAGTFDR